ncbi:MAG TPA: class I SAM-dependent methyltransferase [Candidatus Saccharimonadales bacterium]|nr:class I SAM-dependent methyltransferase [Candidatus Saccharimonadales bacterium]
MAEHTCPTWIGHLLACPLRKFAQDPRKILGPHVREGMRVLDVGCAMGFFSLPLARLVGAAGQVVCVDLQEPMLRALERRARKAGLLERIRTRACDSESLRLGDLAGQMDFALAFAVVHEVRDRARLFTEIRAALKPGALLLLAEPVGHVGRAHFEATLAAARTAGLDVAGTPAIRGSRSALLRRE